MRRLLNLIEKLRSDEGYNARQLAEELGVSRRTMFRDLRSLEKLGVRAQFDEKTQRYTVSMSADLAQAAEITTTELQALLALETPSIANGHQKVKSPTLLANRFGLPDADGLGIQNLSIRETLIHALAENRIVEVETHSDRKQLLEPIRLLNSFCSWQLIARIPGEEQALRIPLREIVSAAVTDASFEPLSDSQAESQLALACRGNGNSVSHATIRLSRSGAKRITADRQLPVQDLDWQEDGVTLRTPMVDLEELAEWILAFGREAEVIGPPDLRARVASHIADLHRRYH